VDWTQLSHDTIQWQTVVNTAVNDSVPQNEGTS
jgi:hypothetical protein